MSLLHELHKANREAPYANLAPTYKTATGSRGESARDSKQAFQRWPHAFRRELLLLSGAPLHDGNLINTNTSASTTSTGADNQIGPTTRPTI